MTPTPLKRARKSWHLVRSRLGANHSPLNRLTITKAKWLHAADSPVMLMVDDLTNAWHSHAGGPVWDPGGDWGGGGRKPGSSLAFLEERLMKPFPEAKVTFFTVAGAISQYTHHQPFSYAAPMDADQSSCDFFRSLADDPRYELAYHGFNHGTAGERTADFVQEWRGFTSVDAAVAQTRRGLEIFARATGSTPRGGKYGGYDYNEFAEAAINECGFVWWCRDWTPRDITGRIPPASYEPQLFGPNLVVALPSTVHGQLWSRRQIDLLLRSQQVISIAEHIAPVRPDGRVQTPNIVDDVDELRRLFGYLRGRNVWHATGTALASYVVARDRSVIHDVTRDGFSVKYCEQLMNPLLTLFVDSAAICTAAEPLIEVTLPDGSPLAPAACVFDRMGFQHVVTLPLACGRYRVRARAS